MSAAHHYDIVIVGTGAGGGTMMHALARNPAAFPPLGRI